MSLLPSETLDARPVKCGDGIWPARRQLHGTNAAGDSRTTRAAGLATVPRQKSRVTINGPGTKQWRNALLVKRLTLHAENFDRERSLVTITTETNMHGVTHGSP